MDHGVSSHDNGMGEVRQTRHPEQKKDLDRTRVRSSIPRASDAGDNWEYPSQQMFFNALKRKGYEVDEDEMKPLIGIHNTVNERSWHEVMRWEESLHPECSNPRLRSLRGRPNDPTPSARWNRLLGYAAPFDRHDWIVDRCGTDVRYVLDYYPGRAKGAGVAGAIYIHARPALDSPQSVLDRIMTFFRPLKRD